MARFPHSTPSLAPELVIARDRRRAFQATLAQQVQDQTRNNTEARFYHAIERIRAHVANLEQTVAEQARQLEEQAERIAELEAEQFMNDLDRL